MKLQPLDIVGPSALALFLLLPGSVPAQASGQPPSPSEAQTATQPTAHTALARTALLEGRAGDAESLLRADLRQAASAPDHLLLCRVLYAESRNDEAEPECETAAAAMPASSEAQLWLGRVYGARASAANPLQAFALARKVRSSFARSVELDGHNLEALNDLGEFYVSAPAIVGGGLDKARALEPQLSAVDSGAGHRLLGEIARKAGDPATAAREFETAARSGRPVDLADLARFHLHQKETDAAVIAARATIAADLRRDASLVDAGSVLIRLNQEPQLALQALNSYVTSPARTDEAPAFKVHLQIARLLRRQGDTDGARREVAVSETLAPGYAAARKAAGDLTP